MSYSVFVFCLISFSVLKHWYDAVKLGFLSPHGNTLVSKAKPAILQKINVIC